MIFREIIIKMKKRVLISILMFVTMLLMVGCGEEEPSSIAHTMVDQSDIVLQEDFPDAQQLAHVLLDKVKTINSVEQEMIARYKINVLIGEESSEQSVSVNSITQTVLDPLVVKMQSVAEHSNTDEIVKTEIYTEKTSYNEITMYLKGGEDSPWLKTTMDIPAGIEDVLNAGLFELIESGETKATVLGETEYVEGKECYVVETYLNSGNAEEAMSNVLSLLQNSGLPQISIEEGTFKEIKISTKIWIDTQSGLPVKFEQDLTDLCNALMEAMLGSLMYSATGMSDNKTDVQDELNYKITVTDYISEIYYRRYNEIESIEIPENVISTSEVYDLY